MLTLGSALKAFPAQAGSGGVRVASVAGLRHPPSLAPGLVFLSVTGSHEAEALAHFPA